MTLPPVWHQVPITGTYTKIDGTPVAGGRIMFTSRYQVSVDGVVVVPRQITINLDVNGSIPVGFSLPSTNDPSITPRGWTYTVDERFDGGRTSFDIFVPFDSTGVNLSTVAPITIIPPIYDYSGLGVSPKFWRIVGDGVTTDFVLDGADVSDPLFYDVAIVGIAKEPYDEYTIIGDPTNGYVVRFTTPPANLANGWVILRGYAKPYVGQAPLTSLAMQIRDVPTPTYTVDNTSEFFLLRSTGAADAAITVRKNDGSKLDWRDGSYFSVCQRGLGQPTIVAPAGVSLIVPAGFKAATRAPGSTISAVCEFADSNSWIVSGDLATAP